MESRCRLVASGSGSPPPPLLGAGLPSGPPPSLSELFEPAQLLRSGEARRPAAQVACKTDVAFNLAQHDPVTAVHYINAHWADVFQGTSLADPAAATPTQRSHPIATLLKVYRHRFNAPGYGRAVATLTTRLTSSWRHHCRHRVGSQDADDAKTKTDTEEIKRGATDLAAQLRGIFEDVMDWTQLNHTVATFRTCVVAKGVCMSSARVKTWLAGMCSWSGGVRGDAVLLSG